MQVYIGLDGSGWTVPCRSFLLLVFPDHRTPIFSSTCPDHVVGGVDMSCTNPSTTHKHVHVPWCSTVPPTLGRLLRNQFVMKTFQSIQTCSMQKVPLQNTMVSISLAHARCPSIYPIPFVQSNGHHPKEPTKKRKTKDQGKDPRDQVPTIDPKRYEPREHHILPTGPFVSALTWPVVLAIKEARPYAHVGRLALRADPTAM